VNQNTLLARLLEWIKSAFTANIGLKALSMVLALGLVAYQRSGQGEQQRTVLVDVTVLPPPDDQNRELMTPVPPHVNLTVRGTARALEQLQPGVPPIEVDLRSGDKARIGFEPSMFELPPGVKVKVIEPTSIELAWQQVITRNVPIQASMTGHIAEGYTVESTRVDPSAIAVKGPASLAEVVQFVRLAAFDVTGKMEGVYRHRMALDPAPPRLQYLGPASATVTVTIARQVIQRKFQKREVTVIGIANGATEPKHVDVTVSGPPDTINSLRDEMIVPRVELEPALTVGRKHGSAVLPVHVDLLQANCEIQPPSVTVVW
jgi:YbbR domain-containing protein